MVLRGLGVRLVGTNDKIYLEIIRHLIEEKKDIQRRLDVVEKILRLHIPLIENKKEK